MRTPEEIANELTTLAIRQGDIRSPYRMSRLNQNIAATIEQERQHQAKLEKHLKTADRTIEELGTELAQVKVERAKLEAELATWKEKHFNDTMSAKKSGWNEGVAYHKQQLSQAEARVKELDCQLEAWQSVFGTSQLTHAIARLEQAEAEITKLTDSPIVRVVRAELAQLQEENARLKSAVVDALESLKWTDSCMNALGFGSVVGIPTKDFENYTRGRTKITELLSTLKKLMGKI